MSALTWRLGAFAGAFLLAACAPLAPRQMLLDDHPLAGKIWDPAAQRMVAAEEALGRAARARYVILGEVHDNPEHHRLQRAVLETLARHGPARALAMEQFDTTHQESIDAARTRSADAEALAEAGNFDRKGWDWPLYRPLVELALDRGWPLIAANLSRAQARAIVEDPARSGLPEADTPLREALERDLIAGHCGERPESRRLAGLVEAQRARDARLARALSASPNVGGVLIAGNGHARKDRGVPLYLPGADLVAIGFLEVEPEKSELQDYFAEGFATAASYDFVWFTARAARPDPCAHVKRSGAAPKAL